MLKKDDVVSWTSTFGKKIKMNQAYSRGLVKSIHEIKELGTFAKLLCLKTFTLEMLDVNKLSVYNTSENVSDLGLGDMVSWQRNEKVEEIGIITDISPRNERIQHPNPNPFDIETQIVMFAEVLCSYSMMTESLPLALLKFIENNNDLSDETKLENKEE